MLLPDYWLTRPSVDFDESTQIAFDELLHTTINSGECPTIPFTLPWQKWQFLCHVADQHDIALHGSGNPDIAMFEPRQANDLGEFGNQKAVYAASDGIWSMFFAIVDRERFAMSVTNACVRLADESGTLHGPYYVFSVSQTVLASQPWRTGTVYLLPRTRMVMASMGIATKGMDEIMMTSQFIVALLKMIFPICLIIFMTRRRVVEAFAATSTAFPGQPLPVAPLPNNPPHEFHPPR